MDHPGGVNRFVAPGESRIAAITRCCVRKKFRPPEGCVLLQEVYYVYVYVYVYANPNTGRLCCKKQRYPDRQKPAGAFIPIHCCHNEKSRTQSIEGLFWKNTNKYWTIWVSNTKNDTYWNDLVILWPHPSGVRDFFFAYNAGGKPQSGSHPALQNESPLRGAPNVQTPVGVNSSVGTGC